MTVVSLVLLLIRNLLVLFSFVALSLGAQDRDLSGNVERTAEANGPVEMSLLVYNTHGLPTIFARDDPNKRFPKIGKLTQQYELSLLQEDYAHHKKLRNGLNRRSLVMRSNERRSFFCLFCYGSGLTIISNLEKEWHLGSQSGSFDFCSGWLRGLNDCFASKGFQLLLIETRLGNRFFVVNTHLDAGQRSLDREARVAQLKQITDRVRQEVSGEALIIAGDLNLNWEDARDRLLLESFRTDLGLIHSGARAKTETKWPILDYIFYRNGRTTTFEILETGEDLSFQNDDGPLSDHPALFMRFLIH